MALEQAVVATLFNQTDEIADEVLHHNPVLAWLKKNGRIRKFSGGYEIRKPVMYNDTAVGGFFQGLSTFNLNSTDDATAFQFAIRQAYEPVVISGREKRANRDEEQLLDLADLKMEAAIARLKNTVSTSIRGDGTGNGGIGFDGIMKAVSTSPTSGSYGGITRSGNTFAQNTAVSVSGGFNVGNVQDSITDGIQRITRGDDSPDLGLTDRTVWKYLHGSMTAVQRITKSGSSGLGAMGFKTLEYDGVEFVYDGGYGSSVLTSGTCRLLNTKYLTFDLVRDADFKPLEPQMVRPADQDGVFTVIIVEGNLCCSAPALQAVLS